jgi:FkbM family methyltransferase
MFKDDQKNTIAYPASAITSYAQNFEDVILWRVLNDVPHGFYIDVGAQHPIIDSVSKAFYEQGWRGVHIEPVAEYAQMLRVDRPDDTVIQAIVAEKSGVFTFYEIPESGLSTVRREVAETHQQKLGLSIRENLVTAVTLDSVLELASNNTIHWLKIDVEGYEREVLAGWHNSLRRPWVIVIESTYPNTTLDTFQNWEDLVLTKNYELVYRDGLNRYYLHQTQMERKKYFIFPPNVFDGFQLSGTATSFTTLLSKKHQQETEQLKNKYQQIITDSQT